MVFFGAGFFGFNFGFGLLLFAGSLFCMRRRRRFEPETALQLALGGLAAPHRFGDQFVGQHQPGLRDILHHQQDIGIFARA